MQKQISVQCLSQCGTEEKETITEQSYGTVGAGKVQGRIIFLAESIPEPKMTRP